MRRTAALALLTLLALVAGPVPGAQAHPLGNASVNHYHGLQLFPDRINDRAVVDVAEIPTLQRRPRVDRDGDGQLSADERAAYASAQCVGLADALRLEVDGVRLPITVTGTSFEERPGAIRLTASRLVCDLTARADLRRPARVHVQDDFDAAGIGWHEITATGTGVRLRESPFPTTSISGELTAYPEDLLSSPLDVRSGTIATEPGSGGAAGTAEERERSGGGLQGRLAALTRTFDELVGRDDLTVGVGLLALLLSVLLGAGHALLPGHGKTIMAAYLVGRQGRLRDVVAVGATVTVTHTAGVLILGAVVTLTSAVAPTAVQRTLAIVSGLLVAAVGVGLLVTALRGRARAGVEDALGGLLPGHGHTHAPAPEPALAGAPAARTRLRSDAAHHDHDHGHPHDDHPHDDHPHDDHDHRHGDHGHPHDEHGHPHDGHGHDHGHGHGPRDDSHPHDDHDHAPHGHDQDHDHRPHDHGDGAHGHAHGHPHDHGSPHGASSHEHATHAHGHPHPHGQHGHRHGRLGLVGLGVAGGLVPSPSALLVLLAAAALGRTVFGVLLVLGYGVGMALALCAAGLLLVRLRDRLASRRWGAGHPALARLQAVTPVLTAALVLLVGIGLAVRAVGGQV